MRYISIDTRIRRIFTLQRLKFGVTVISEIKKFRKYTKVSSKRESKINTRSKSEDNGAQCNVFDL